MDDIHCYAPDTLDHTGFHELYCNAMHRSDSIPVYFILSLPCIFSPCFLVIVYVWVHASLCDPSLYNKLAFADKREWLHLNPLIRVDRERGERQK